MDTARMEDQLYFVTFFVEAQKGRPVSTGTGFFYEHRVHDKRIPALIANRHVIEGFDQASVRIFASDDGTAPISIPPLPMRSPAARRVA